MTEHRSEHGTLPLAPIDAPRGFVMRVLFASMRSRYGKTPMAFRVLYARMPWLALVSMVFVFVFSACMRLERSLCFLLQVTVASQNGCTFCADLYLAEALRARIGRERFAEIHDFESSTRFDAREKAALAYATALGHDRHIPDEVWARLARHFDERERVEIVWLCAVEHYFNAMALPLRIGSDHLAEANAGLNARGSAA